MVSHCFHPQRVKGGLEGFLRGMCSTESIIHKAFGAAAAGLSESLGYFSGAWWDAGLVA